MKASIINWIYRCHLNRGYLYKTCRKMLLIRYLFFFIISLLQILSILIWKTNGKMILIIPVDTVFLIKSISDLLTDFWLSNHRDKLDLFAKMDEAHTLEASTISPADPGRSKQHSSRAHYQLLTSFESFRQN